MVNVIKIKTPLNDDTVLQLKAGDNVLISGYLYTGRDAAHKRLVDLIEEGKELPIDVNGQIIYYVGPAPAKPGHACGSAGPTTSMRLEKLENEFMIKNKAVYFGAVGGAAALISKSIVKSETICYEDLGTEAIHRFLVEDFPAIVIIDAFGNNLYETEPPKYAIE